MTTLLGHDITTPTLNALSILREWCNAAEEDSRSGYDSYRGEFFFARVTGARSALRYVYARPCDSGQRTKQFITELCDILEKTYACDGQEWEKVCRLILDKQGLPV